VDWLKPVRFYGSLVRSTPAHIWRAADVVGRAALLLGVFIVAVLGLHGDIPVGWLIALLGLVVVGALLKANYDRYAALQSDRNFWWKQVHDDINRKIQSFEHDMAWDALMGCVKSGREDVWKPLLSGASGSESDWVANVDRWETETIRQLEKHWAAEATIFRSDSGLLDGITDWRARLTTRMDIKLTRLMDIAKRQTGSSDG